MKSSITGDNTLDYRDRFAYDPAGNRVEKSRDAGNNGSVDRRTSYRFDANDRLVDEIAVWHIERSAIANNLHLCTHAEPGYRAVRFVAGSPSPRPQLDHAYTYDLQGRLFTATVTNYSDAGSASSITRSTYDYDPHGIRISALNEIDANADGNLNRELRSSTSSIIKTKQVISKSSAKATST